MPLDVEPPSPPTLEAVDAEEDYHREDLEAFLHDGAWDEAFDEWAAETNLDERGFEIVRDLEMIQQFDFFWDDFVSRVGFHAPGLPENWRESELHPELDSWETASTINASLAELGSRVGSILTEEYVDWDTEEQIGEDLPEFD